MRAQESQRLRAQEAESQVESLEGEQRWRRSTTSCRLLRCACCAQQRRHQVPSAAGGAALCRRLSQLLADVVAAVLALLALHCTRPEQDSEATAGLRNASKSGRRHYGPCHVASMLQPTASKLVQPGPHRDCAGCPAAMPGAPTQLPTNPTACNSFCAPEYSRSPGW